MTPQEQLDWFWVVGELPGTIFGDLSDPNAKLPGQARRWQAKWLQLASRKPHKELLEHDGSRTELKPSG